LLISKVFLTGNDLVINSQSYTFVCVYTLISSLLSCKYTFVRSNCILGAFFKTIPEPVIMYGTHVCRKITSPRNRNACVFVVAWGDAVKMHILQHRILYITGDIYRKSPRNIYKIFLFNIYYTSGLLAKKIFTRYHFSISSRKFDI